MKLKLLSEIQPAPMSKTKVSMVPPSEEDEDSGDGLVHYRKASFSESVQPGSNLRRRSSILEKITDDTMVKDLYGLELSVSNDLNDVNGIMHQLDVLCYRIYDAVESQKDTYDGSTPKEVLLDLVDTLKGLQSGARLVAGFAHQYDYQGIRANGYWSCLKIGLELGRIFDKKYGEDLNPEEILKDQELLTLAKYFTIALGVLVTLREDSVAQTTTDHHPQVLTTADGRRVSVDINADGAYKRMKDMPLMASSKTVFVEMFSLLLSINDKMVGTMYGSYCGFWLGKMARFTTLTFVTTLAIFARPFSSFRLMVDPSYRGLILAKLIKSADVHFVKKMGSMADSLIYKSIIPFCLYGWSPNIQTTFYSPRQLKYVINTKTFKLDTRYHSKITFTSETPIGVENYSLKNYRNKIRIRLFKEETMKESHDKVIFHLHGGGFVTGSPESHEVYLRDWANQIPGVPIVSIDYTVAPDVKFPSSLQEALDCYLYLMNGPECEIKSILGYQPKTVVFVGDSAGANLLTALVLVLNDIRKSQKLLSISRRIVDQVILPKAVVALYTPFNLSLKLTPSNILSCCDSMISAGIMLSCFEAYLPEVSISEDEFKDEVKETILEGIKSNYPLADIGRRLSRRLSSTSSCVTFFESTTRMLSNRTVSMVAMIDDEAKVFLNRTCSKLAEFYFGFKSSVNYYLDRIASYGALDPHEPWFLKPKPYLYKRMEAIEEVTSNPYVSPIFYEDFDSLKDVSLGLIALHFDPFLDDSISMAKKWKGPVILDVLDGLQHGFLNFMPFVRVAKEGSNLAVRRLKHFLDIDS